jgi:eukaryotic-like serine/threonine-protein kinase
MVGTGTQLGPYKILGSLGAGGMGEVYRAQDGRLGRDVALKVLHEQFAHDPDRLMRFEREARAVAGLTHPNILVLHDFGTEKGLTFAVTELLEGESLRQRLAHAALPWRKAVELAVAIAEGLAAAHAKGIVHRDLKPDNVFVTADERVKILDFGLAKLIDEARPVEAAETQGSTLTKTGTILGTAPYMSPEQLRCQAVDARTDIFSFGCMLYEMVAGKRPFSGRTYADIVGAILHSNPQNLAEAGIKVPAELERVIGRCLEKNPEARFHSARDLAFALRGIGLSSGEVAPAPAPAVRSRSHVIWAASALALAGLGLAIAFWAKGAVPTNERSIGDDSAKIMEVAVLPFVNNTKDAENDYLGDGLPGGIIKSLSEVANLKVRSFSTVSRCRAPDLNLGEMGRQLKVHALLTGKIWPKKDGVALSVELVNVGDDSVLWSERYESKCADLQAVQSEIAKQICAKLRVPTTADEDKRLGRRFTENAEAFQLYVKGRYHWFKETEVGWKKAEEYFNQAIAVDPAYALAHAGLADTYFASSGRLMSPRQAAPMARKAAQNSLELDDNLAEAHIALGNILFWHDWDWPAAEKEFKRAIELKPSLALAHDAYFTFLVLLGRSEEAAKAMRQAVQLDPLTPYINIDAAWLEYYTRHFDLAIEHSKKVIELDRHYGNAHWILAMAQVHKGQHSKALAGFQRLRQQDDSPLNVAWAAYGHGVSGDKAEAHRLLEELTALAEERYVDPAAFAIIHLGLEDKDQANQWLEKARDARSSAMVWLKVDPLFDELRGEPRFTELVKKMNFP